jgi:hypothetical protein
MSDRFTFGTALYHPTIDIDDAAWLRNAILFWDRIETIVPSSIDTPYRHRDTRILSAEGLLAPLPPDRHRDVLDRLEIDVINFLDNTDENEFLGIRETGQGTAETELLHAGKLGFLLGDEVGGSRVHQSKMAAGLHHRLGDWEPDEDGFLHVHPRFADFYMSILAAGLAKKTGASPVSNHREAFGANLRTIVGQAGAPDGSDHGTGALVSITMENLVIDPAVPIEQLLAFKRRNADELEQLAVEFDALAGTIKDAESVEELRKKATHLYNTKVRIGMKKLQTRLRRQSIGCALGGVALAATLGTAATVSTAGAFALGATAFLTLSSFAVNGRFALSNTKLDSPFTYLADLQRDFAIPSRLIED